MTLYATLFFTTTIIKIWLHWGNRKINETQVLGVGVTRTGYLIRFRNEEQADTEWLGDLGNNAKLVRPRFGVVVHRTPTDDFLSLQDDDARIHKITEENEMEPHGFRISQIAWLRKDKEDAIGKHGSLGIWFDTREAAEWLIDRGLLVGHTCRTLPSEREKMLSVPRIRSLGLGMQGTGTGLEFLSSSNSAYFEIVMERCRLQRS